LDTVPESNPLSSLVPAWNFHFFLTSRILSNLLISWLFLIFSIMHSCPLDLGFVPLLRALAAQVQWSMRKKEK
jgi:hypothetical protein